MDDMTKFFVQNKKLATFINEPIDAKMPIFSYKMRVIIMEDNSPDPDLLDISPAEQP